MAGGVSPEGISPAARSLTYGITPPQVYLPRLHLLRLHLLWLHLLRLYLLWLHLLRLHLLRLHLLRLHLLRLHLRWLCLLYLLCLLCLLCLLRLLRLLCLLCHGSPLLALLALPWFTSASQPPQAAAPAEVACPVGLVACLVAHTRTETSAACKRRRRRRRRRRQVRVWVWVGRRRSCTGRRAWHGVPSSRRRGSTHSTSTHCSSRPSWHVLLLTTHYLLVE